MQELSFRSNSSIDQMMKTEPQCSSTTRKAIQILGTRGIPGRHGGFETFAEQLSLYLVSRGWDVTVYCQLDEGIKLGYEDIWNGAKRVHLPGGRGAKGTLMFDLAATKSSLLREGHILILGYNTAVLSFLLRVRARKSIMNMDGIEWKRAKWSLLLKSWFQLNEYMGAKLSTHLIADHPEIKLHLSRHTPGDRITVIPYAAHLPDEADPQFLQTLGLKPELYFLVIARPERENSILETVRAFSARARGMKLVLLGDYRPTENHYHAQVIDIASSECVFPGAIYDARILSSLRVHARAYIHGHQVGGTNPSLVEALACGSPVIAHDNRFNRWVAGEAAAYFLSEGNLDQIISRFVATDAGLKEMRKAAFERYLKDFTYDKVMSAYESLLEDIF